MSATLRLTTGVVYVRSWSGTLSGATLGVDTLKLDSTNLDVQLSRGAANRLDLATGDSLRLQGTGTLQLADGTVGAPSLSFASDAARGFYKQSAAYLGIVGHLAPALGGVYDLGQAGGTFGVGYFGPQNIGTTTTAGLTLQNTTAAAAGAQQYSPGLSLIGQGWKTDATAASQPVETRWELRPVEGAAAPTYNHVLMGRVNNGAWTDLITVSSVGVITATSNIYSGGDVRAASNSSFYFASRSLISSLADGALDVTNAAVSGFTRLNFGPAAGATTSAHLQKKITAIADNTATTVFTVTVPNANHAAAIRLFFLSSNGSTDAFESSRAASGMVVVARTTGANAVVTAATIDDAAIATVAAGATHTLAYSVSAVSGAVGDSNTFTIQVTIDDSGNLGGNQLVAVAELLNAEATGVTIA